MKFLIKVAILMATLVTGLSPLANADSSLSIADSYDLGIYVYLQANDALGNSL